VFHCLNCCTVFESNQLSSAYNSENHRVFAILSCALPNKLAFVVFVPIARWLRIKAKAFCKV
jgi:hypothetical protein